MIERGRCTESLANPEISSPEHYAGLHPRLLMGGAFLNPAKQDISNVTSANLGSLTQRDYSPFANASLKERVAYWDQKNEIADQDRYQAWTASCVSTFDNAKAFFQDTDKGKDWSKFYSKLNIDTQNFTSQTTEGLYNRYFQPNTSGIRLFIEDILRVHVKDRRINMAELEANLAAVGWLSHIFGNVSSEVITQMVTAEARLISNPDQLVQQANSRQVADEPTRVNNLNSDEQRILKFLWESPRETTQESPTPEQEEEQSQSIPLDSLKFRYERLGDPRVFPREENIQENLLNPAKVAAVLRQGKPEKYGYISQEQLTQEIAVEQKQFKTERENTGLTNDYLREIILQNLNNYESFLTEKYGVNLPVINYVQLVPLSGKTAEAFGQQPGRFAFVDARRPAIFMDFDVIYAAAEQLGRAEHKVATGVQFLREMTRGEIRSLIMRLLNEVNPHEYSHLTGDMAFWKIIKQTEDQEELLETITGKTGLKVAKPVLFTVNNQTRLNLQERGRGLSEGVTVELTDQWARSFNAQLDIPAYTAERRVLHRLTNLLVREQGISEEEAFKKVAVGYFNPQGFRHLVEELSGKTVTPEGVSFKRPHLLQIVYALMEYETVKAAQERREVNYPMALEYINSANNLSEASDVLKGEIANMIRVSRQLGSPISLSPRAISYLVQQAGIQIEDK